MRRPTEDELRRTKWIRKPGSERGSRTEENERRKENIKADETHSHVIRFKYTIRN